MSRTSAARNLWKQIHFHLMKLHQTLVHCQPFFLFLLLVCQVLTIESVQESTLVLCQL